MKIIKKEVIKFIFNISQINIKKPNEDIIINFLSNTPQYQIDIHQRLLKQNPNLA